MLVRHVLSPDPWRAQVITTPFWPAYITAERIAKAPKLKLALTAGIGSDHVDLPAASKAGITVAEVTGGSPWGGAVCIALIVSVFAAKCELRACCDSSS